MRRWISLTLIVAAFMLATSSSAAADSSPKVAAIQAALWRHGLYRGDVNGIMTRATVRAVVRLQERAKLVADGIVGPKTRPYLGKLRGPALGSRTLRLGLVGGDVAGLQFLLARHGFPCALFDGVMGTHTVAALRRFQSFAGLPVSGLGGRRTLAALAAPAPQAPAGVLEWPAQAQITSAFGPRGNRFHAGIDLATPNGTPVQAAGEGSVVFAGPGAGYGLLVVIEHSGRLRSYYAHLSHIDVVVGQHLRVGAQLGLSGSTGEVTGPHLHFELRLNGAAVDPLPALR